ncbi:MAG: STAS domain-containing protein [bacterium]
MPQYAIEHNDRRGVVTLAGDLTAALVPGLQSALKGVLSQGADELVFDLAQAAMLDSSGMGLLIAASNSLARNGGRIRVINVSADILRLLQSMRLAGRLNASGRPDAEVRHG